jgi:hypothetical protein
MAMVKPLPATCCKCGKEGVLCCSHCGLCAKCSEHDGCEQYSNVVMDNPQPATCINCGKQGVLCCSKCGSCGCCSNHDECRKQPTRVYKT